MPIHNHLFPQQTPAGPMLGGITLMQAGPFVPVEVSIPDALAQVLTETGQPIPTPVVGAALIDTGAGRSCISTTVVQHLNLQPISAVPVGTANGTTIQGTFPARFRFSSMNLEIQFGSVLGANLSGQMIQGMPLIVLIGRDLLAGCLLVYNGTMGQFTLAM